jgi:hypothetical protein
MKVNKHIARADIYRHGLRTPADNKKGYTLDRSQPRGIDDVVIVPKGTEYYKWQKKNQPPTISLTPPTRQQLTSSDFLIQIYDLEDDINSFQAEGPEDIQSAVDGWREQVETLRDELEEKRENMPESLQESPVGQLLQERYDALDEWLNELDSIDLDDYPTEEIDTEDEELEDIENDETEQTHEERLREWLDEKIDEIQNLCFNV